MIVDTPALRQASSTDMVGAMAPQLKTSGESTEQNGCKSSRKYEQHMRGMMGMPICRQHFLHDVAE